MMLARQAARSLRHPRLDAIPSTARTIVTVPARLSSASLAYSSAASACSRRHAPRRTYATPPPQVVHSDLPVQKYHAYADATMDQLLESLENALDSIGDPEYEVEYSSGVLTLKLGAKGTYVINKQPPNKQIWLSSPVSGPKRYDYSPALDDWVYGRDGRPMSALLEQELGSAFGGAIQLGISRVSALAR
ncbi:Frataxin [Wolfiporia cocos MD-104 SS10]|uniref:ferroxidase n=1 Tax=Wolfiporia cocos (strain MD-104) TaxID=742152 RepID=A0A2H3IUQ7_WOLCO|nr:Frataxin [Wolfiporia cocos MD-104 SS10]